MQASRNVFLSFKHCLSRFPKPCVAGSIPAGGTSSFVPAKAAFARLAAVCAEDWRGAAAAEAARLQAEVRAISGW